MGSVFKNELVYVLISWMAVQRNKSDQPKSKSPKFLIITARISANSMFTMKIPEHKSSFCSTHGDRESFSVSVVFLMMLKHRFYQ